MKTDVAEPMPQSVDPISVAGRTAAFVAQAIAPGAPAMARGEGPSPKHVLASAAGHDLAGLLIPARYGGQGASHVAFADVVEAIARRCASSAVILDVHMSVATEPILMYGSDEQKREYLPRLASGAWLGGFALTEPGSGSDAAGLTTRAVRHGDGYRITGMKTFITNAGAADVYVVLARTGDAGAHGVTAFLVDAATPGVVAGTPLAKMGLRGSWTADVIFDDVVVPAAGRLGAEGEGFAIAMAALDSGRVGISAQAVGIGQAALDAAVASARNRSDGAVTKPDEVSLADMEARTQAARALTCWAAALLDRGEPARRIAAAAKLYATDAGVATAHDAMQLCAPESGSSDHPAAIALCDAKACQIYEGTNQIQRIVVARELLR